MAQYYFDVHSRTRQTCDDDGHDCPDRDAVSMYALQVLCDIARHDPLSGRGGELTSVVRDTTNRVVLIATLNLSTIWIGDA